MCSDNEKLDKSLGENQISDVFTFIQDTHAVGYTNEK